jgi:hypothetical protein
MLPLPTFRDLPAMVANLTATPGLPAHVVAATTPSPVHLPTLVATTTTSPPVVLQTSCNTSLAEVSSLLWTHNISLRGEEGHCVCHNTTLLLVYMYQHILNVMTGAAEDCGGPAGPAPAGD